MDLKKFPKPDDLGKVPKAKFFNEMSKYLGKKMGKVLTIYVIEKISLLPGINNKPFAVIGKIDAKKNPEWAELLSTKAIKGKCLCEKAVNGILKMQIKAKGYKKEADLEKLLGAECIAIEFVNKLLKDGKEVNEEEEENDESETPESEEIVLDAPQMNDLQKYHLLKQKEVKEKIEEAFFLYNQLLQK